IFTTRLSSVITGWPRNETTCSRRSIRGLTRSMNGTIRVMPGASDLRSPPALGGALVEDVRRPPDQGRGTGAQQRRLPDVAQRERPYEPQPGGRGEGERAELQRRVPPRR